MTTAAATTPASPGAVVPMRRHILVELRKLVDTRAGLWLLITIAAVTLVADLVAALAIDRNDVTFEDFLGVTALPQALLLPVLGILTVTSEWGQRTALTTFALEPRRLRVGVAKLVAAVLLGLAFVVIALVVAAAANGLNLAVHGGEGNWDVGGHTVLELVVLQLLGVVQGVAFGLLIMNTAGAIVAYFVAPTVFSILVNIIPGLEGAAPWLDLSTATGPLLNTDESVTGTVAARIAVAALIWIVVPLAVGTWRLLRREVKSA